MQPDVEWPWRTTAYNWLSDNHKPGVYWVRRGQETVASVSVLPNLVDERMFMDRLVGLLNEPDDT